MTFEFVPERYNGENLRRLVRNPRLALAELGNLRRSIARALNNAVFRVKYDEPFDLMAEDWDNLILLDACRADVYQEQTPFSTAVETRLSCGSGTPEFIQRNFVGEQHHDTVYLSSNPYVSLLNQGAFHEVIPLLDEWDENQRTVPPGNVTAAARAAAERFSDKRLIVHFMQPHTPHLGPTATRLRENLELRGWDHDHVEEGTSTRTDGTTIWDLVRTGEMTHETLRQSYRENLDIVLDEVQKLVPILSGKTVVSADHGEMLGERLFAFGPKEFGHTVGLLTEELRMVPWQVVKDDERREIVAEPPVASERLAENETRRRLRALGYVD
jgi:hypothetical protein